ncbi:MAG: insulinase family protein [Clostridiales bacterium]|nr:insulinase family protein [Clostridiales bacterium]
MREVMYFDRRLTNGIRVVGQHIPGFSSAAVGLWVRTGSANETLNEGGISHFIEHMVFKGTGKRSAAQIAAEMDDVGGILNAFTSKECTCYHAKVVSSDLEKALELICDIAFHSVLDPDELKKEQGVVIEEINMVEDTPDDLVHELLSEAYFGDHPLARPILGTAETVSFFSPAALRDYMARRYGADAITIVVAGGFDFDAFCAMAERYTEGCIPSNAPAAAVPRFDLGFKSFVYKVKPIEQAHIAMAMPGYTMGVSEVYATAVFNNIFGGSMSSRLFQVIREEMGLAYDVYSHPSSYSAAGCYNLYTAVNPKRAKDALGAILDQIDLARKHGITKEEFNRGKNQLRGNYILGLESTTSRMNALGKNVALLGHIKTAEDSIAGIEAVTYDDVHRILERVLDREHMAVSAVGNVKPDELKALL